MRWSLAVIAGGGAAGLVQGATVLTRGASGLTTGGLGNHVVATFEWIGAAVTSLMAIFAPLLITLLLLAFGIVLGVRLYRHWRSSRPEISPATI
jgi:hypothetical protein